ncbi:unnamed protein product [marine sediment metagenome]|uniref:Uncharacterized protein n=1 Tax=marine sediment metagenome TaxID=412755 RepID=X1ANM8_9ZZZZ
MLERNGISADFVDLRSLVDKQLTLSENIALISEAVHTSLRVEHYPSEKELLKEQSDMWTTYMRENHLTHYVAYKRDGKTISDKVGKPIHGFLLLEYIKNN